MARIDPVRIYRYVLTSDDGVAPCVDDDLLTLATCKPVIRRVARVGDWVVGFRGKAPAGVVIWAGRIACKFSVGDYEARHRGRADAVYRLQPDGSYLKLRPDYHARREDVLKDLSGPALVFDPASTWYFGSDAQLSPDTLMHLAASGQGHRVNFRRPGDEDVLLGWLNELGPPGIHGLPQAEAHCGGCGSSSGRKGC
jgi:hypothetical protein